MNPLEEFHRNGVSTTTSREVWNYFQCLLNPIAVSNHQRCAQAAKIEKEYKPQYLHLLTKITWFLECTANLLENNFLESTSK